MTSTDPLLTIAEVSVAFAGFASIVTVVASRGADSWSAGNLVRFRLMIYMSLSSVLFSLLPFSFLLFNVSELATWQTSSSILGIYLGCYLVLTIRGFISLVRQGQLNIYVTGFTAALGVSAILVQLFSIIDAVSAHEGAYFVGVLYLLLMSAISFARLVAVSILPANR